MSNTDPENSERGILTDADIEYLKHGGENLSHGAEFNARRRIVDRTRAAILDFTVLLDHLGDRDLGKVFSLGGTVGERNMMLDGVQDAIGLFYLGLKDNATPFDFEPRLKGGVNRAQEREYGDRHRPVDIEFDVEELPVTTRQEIFLRLHRGELDSLSEGELRSIMKRVAKHIDGSIAEAIREGERDMYLRSIAKKGPMSGIGFPYADVWQDLDWEEQREILENETDVSWDDWTPPEQTENED